MILNLQHNTLIISGPVSMEIKMSKPKKVTVVAQRVPYPPNKGEKLRTYHQIKFLSELGYYVEVLCAAESELDIKIAGELSENLNIKVKAFLLPHRAKRYCWALFHRQAISVGAFYCKALQYEVDKCLSGSCDVLLLSASSLGYYVFSSSQYPSRKCALLMDMMDVDSDKWLQYASSSSHLMKAIYNRESKKIKNLEMKANYEFESTFLIANEEVSLFERTVSKHQPVKVLGNGLDFSTYFPSNNPPSEVNFLFTGVMDYKPNVDAVLWFVENCWPVIKKHLPAAMFVVGGMNPTREVLRLPEYDANVIVTGFVDDMLPFFHKASAFVAPFRLARGVQNKVLQAAACKLPIITTSMGAEGISFASEETMYVANTERSFAQACIEAVTNPHSSKQRALNAYNALNENYSWEHQLQPLKQMMESI